MTTPLIWPTNTNQEPPKPVRCPHCRKKLKGFQKNDNSVPSSLLEWLVGLSIVVIAIMNILGALFGFVDATLEPCRPAFSERIDFVVPAYPGACHITKWLTKRTDK
jgi:hypothetical protein